MEDAKPAEWFLYSSDSKTVVAPQWRWGEDAPTQAEPMSAAVAALFQCQGRALCGACAHRWKAVRQSVLPSDPASLVRDYAAHTCLEAGRAIAEIVGEYETAPAPAPAPSTHLPVPGALTFWGSSLRVTTSRTGEAQLEILPGED